VIMKCYSGENSRIRARQFYCLESLDRPDLTACEKHEETVVGAITWERRISYLLVLTLSFSLRHFPSFVFPPAPKYQFP
jgi:hypothetical protein